MDGRAEGMRIERDPTMDHRIVHSVCVYNKKEQAHLKDTERNLQNEFKVEQHIIRREEKELLKQLQKLQLEKYHRHPEEVHSPGPNFKRAITPRIVVPSSRHSIAHRSPLSSPMPSRHEVVDLTKGHTIHHTSQPTAYPTYPSSSYTLSNISSSFISSNNSLRKEAENRLFLPVLETRTRNPGDSTVSRDNLRGHEGISDNTHDTTHRDGHPSKPYHLVHHHHHHHKHQHHHISSEIQGLLHSLTPHQPAGYGHSIKELKEHKDTIRRRHRFDHDSHRRRRHSVDFDCPQNYRPVGNLHLLNDIGPYTHKTTPQKPDQSDAKTSINDRPMKTDESLPNKTKGTHREPDTVDGKSSKDVTSVVHDHKPGIGAVLHKSDGDIVDRKKKQHDVHEKENTAKGSSGQNLQITIKIKRKERTGKTGQRQAVAFTTKPTEQSARAVSKETSTDATHQRSTVIHHGVAKFRSSQIPKDMIVPVMQDGGSEEKQDARYISTEKDSVGSSDHGSSVDLPSDTLAELQALSGSSTQGYFTAQGTGFASRKNRFRQLAKELLMKQIPALTRKRQLAEFDPLEALQCRYLRLTPSNIQDLVDKCKESGIDVGIHPHSTIEDINEFVFGEDDDSSFSKDNQ